MALIILLFTVSVALCQVQNGKTKRLLENDPDVSGARLTNLERSVQDLTRSVSQLKGDLAQEKLTVSQLKGEHAQEKLTVSQLQSELTTERAKILQLEVSSKDYGSTYVRWGKKQCSGSNTEMVYTGFAAGNPYYISNYYGGPANMLCLPNNPELSNRTGTGQSFVYGTEFESGTFFGKGAQDEDVPCCLCRSKSTSTSVMIPGRRTCYNGWKLEYNGVLAAGHKDYKPSSYICVDGNPEYLQAGEANNNGNLLYGVTTKCGPLPCPPYSKNMAVNCVVCSK